MRTSSAKPSTAPPANSPALQSRALRCTPSTEARHRSARRSATAEVRIAAPDECRSLQSPGRRQAFPPNPVARGGCQWHRPAVQEDRSGVQRATRAPAERSRAAGANISAVCTLVGPTCSTFSQVRALCPGRDSNPYAFRLRGLSSIFDCSQGFVPVQLQRRATCRDCGGRC